MNENHKANKGKNKKNNYTKNLFKISQDEEFFKSSSEDISNSVSFRKEIKHSEENLKIPKEKNILLINKRLKEKNILISKGSTSSSNKINNVYKTTEEIKEKENNDKNNENKIINFEEIEYSDNHDNHSHEKDKKDEYININDYKKNVSKKVMKSKYILSLKEESSSSKENDEEDINNILNNYVDSSYNSSKRNSSNNIINNQNQKNNSKDNSNNNKNNSNSNNSKKNITKEINRKKNEESYIDSEKDLNNNKQTIITLKPMNINVGGNQTRSRKYTFQKKLSTIQTSSERQNIKNNTIKRKACKRISQREYSVNTSKSENINDNNEENKIKIFIQKYFFNIPILIILIIIHFFSLFSNDIRHIWLDKKTDIYFDIINIISLFFFTSEIIILCLLDDKYFLSFIFLVDIIGILCIIFNVELINNYIFYDYKINNESQTKINNSVEYLYICIIMLERVIRISKILKCLKLYNLIETINKFKELYSKKQQRDFVKEENQKKKINSKNKKYRRR